MLGLLGSRMQPLLGGFVFGELFGFFEEGGFDFVVEALDEGECVEAAAGHAALEDE